MKRLIALAIFACLLMPCAARAEDDSMATFKAMLQYNAPPATDIGGWVAPEIFSVNQYPYRPKAGDAITVRAVVRSYNGMVSYRVADVSLAWWKKGGEKQTVAMKPEDAQLGIYSATLPAFKQGDEIFYSVSARDDWGNAAIELPPDDIEQTLMTDTQDAAISPSLDIRSLAASYSPGGKLALCMDLTDKPLKNLGSDMLAYGMMVFENDVRYKPEQTETELNSAYLAAYLPAFSISGLLRTNELLGALTGGSKSENKTQFKKTGNRLCFRFSPDAVREDYANGLKIAGATIAVSAGQFVPKLTDTTHMVMLYPVSRYIRIK